MTELAQRIEDLEPDLFDRVESLTTANDRRALLAIHAAAARVLGSFTLLEIGSYLGGSLQVAIRDPRCSRVISIDPRPEASADKRAHAPNYPGNTKARMLEGLAALPDADMTKLTIFDVSTHTLRPADLPAQPQVCLVDGEHTDEAVLRDARFCAESMTGSGVVLFHDYELIRPGVVEFLREAWSQVSLVLAFRRHTSGLGGVLAVELGPVRILRQPIVAGALGSRWRGAVWRAACGLGDSPGALLATWRFTSALDDWRDRPRVSLQRLFGQG